MSEILNKIIAIEHKAQEIVEDAYKQKKEMLKSFDLACSKINTDILAKQQKQLEIIKETEQKFADEKISEINTSTKAALENLTRLYEEKKADWVQETYNNIIRR